MIRRPPRSTRVRSSAASDVYKRQFFDHAKVDARPFLPEGDRDRDHDRGHDRPGKESSLLDCGGRVAGIADTVGAVLTSDRPELLARRFPDSWECLLYTSP